MEHQLEDLKAMEAKVEAARTSNVELTESLEEKNQELSAATHALQDAEINLRQAESHNVQLGIEVEELREQVVQLRAQEIELQLELKSMLGTLTMVTHRDEEEGEGEGKGFASPVQLERVIEKFDTPLSERIHGDDGDDMSEVQSRMAILLLAWRVQDARRHLQGARRVGRSSIQASRSSIRRGRFRRHHPARRVVSRRLADLSALARDHVEESRRRSQHRRGSASSRSLDV